MDPHHRSSAGGHQSHPGDGVGDDIDSFVNSVGGVRSPSSFMTLNSPALPQAEYTLNPTSSSTTPAIAQQTSTSEADQNTHKTLYYTFPSSTNPANAIRVPYSTSFMQQSPIMAPILQVIPHVHEQLVSSSNTASSTASSLPNSIPSTAFSTPNAQSVNNMLSAFEAVHATAFANHPIIPTPVHHNNLNIRSNDPSASLHPENSNNNGGEINPRNLPGLTGEQDASRVGKRKQCHCKNSKCLKLYCECFASRVFCSGCNCVDCHNNEAHEASVKKAVTSVLERNASAFKPKPTQQTITPAVANAKGCHCRRSGCYKKYCECFQANVLCTALCKCTDCRNTDSAHPQAHTRHTTASTSYFMPNSTATLPGAVNNGSETAAANGENPAKRPRVAKSASANAKTSKSPEIPSPLELIKKEETPPKLCLSGVIANRTQLHNVKELCHNLAKPMSEQFTDSLRLQNGDGPPSLVCDEKVGDANKSPPPIPPETVQLMEQIALSGLYQFLTNVVEAAHETTKSSFGQYAFR